MTDQDILAQPDMLQRRMRLVDRLSDQQRNQRWLSLGVALAGLVGLVFYTFAAVQSFAWQHFALIGITAVLFIVGLAGAWMSYHGKGQAAVWIILVVGLVAVAVSPFFIAQLGIWYAAGVMMSTLIISTLTIPPGHASSANLLGVVMGMLTLILDGFFGMFQIQPPQVLLVFIPAVVVFLALLYIIIVSVFFPTFSMRVKITVAVFSAALLAITILSVTTNYLTRRELVAVSNRTLLLAANQIAQSLDLELTQNTESVARQAASDLVSRLMAAPDDPQAIEPAAAYLRSQVAISGVDYFALLNRDGRALVHTRFGDASQIPANLGLGTLFRNAFLETMLTNKPYVSPLIFPANRETPYYLVGISISTVEGTPLGILLAAYPVEPIQRIVAGTVELAGPGSFGVLVDENHLRIAHGLSPDSRYRLVAPVDEALLERLQSQQRLPAGQMGDLATSMADFEAGLDDIGTTPYFTADETGSTQGVNVGAMTRLRTNSWIVVMFQPQATVLGTVNQQTRLTILIAAAVAVLSIIGSGLLARLLANPLLKLTDVAQQAAEGDLTVQSPVVSQDEIGALSKVFNGMIAQLRQLVLDLEKRVADRTEELQKSTELMTYRAERLQKVAETAHLIAEIRDPDQLLPELTKTISERFDYYHVGVFLLDKAKEYAVLQAANSPGGQRMLARGHRLKSGEVGIVGYVTGHGEGRIALDVGKDAVYFDNPDLPETRSEIALPLRVGEDVIGALDVQSKVAGAFTQEDVALLSALADQVAMAIQNSRLFGELDRTVRDLQVAQQQYLVGEWGRLAAERKETGYHYEHGTLVPVAPGSSGDTPIRAQSGEGQTIITESSTSLVMPISLRGQVIGEIGLESLDQRRVWTQEERQLVQSVADQVGLALENARLLEETLRRAERERAVSEITTRMRTTNDPQAILETALSELRHALQVKNVRVQFKPTRQVKPAAGDTPPTEESVPGQESR